MKIEECDVRGCDERRDFAEMDAVGAAARQPSRPVACGSLSLSEREE